MKLEGQKLKQFIEDVREIHSPQTKQEHYNRINGHIASMLDLDNRLHEANQRVWKARRIVEDNVEEVTLSTGAVVGYKLNLNVEQTRELWNILCDDDGTLAEKV